MKIALTESDRSFFALAADAAFSNPFSEKRERIDRQLAGVLTKEPWQNVLPAVTARLAKKLDRLDEKIDGKVKFTDFAGADNELIKYVLLFDIFHKFAAAFDALIQKQLNSPDKPAAAEFVPQLTAALVCRGFSQNDAVRGAGLFYQMRRGYCFINRTIVGDSDCVRTLRMDLWNNIFTADIRIYEKYLHDRMEDFSTLLEGPTGSGKGAAAAAIGLCGYIPYNPEEKTFADSFVKMFVPANLSQITPALMESELFGHCKGAFTGAIAEHTGLFGLCRPYGTIFLDEIAETGPQVQVKLLKVLEERLFTPVGGHCPQQFRGRIVAATNRQVQKLLETGDMREDLYYRLCSDVIKVPTLKQRIGENTAELQQLVRHFVRQITGCDAEELCEKTLDVIKAKLPPDYDWPGNVRELAQCIRRVVLKQDYRGQKTADKNLLEQIQTGIENGTIGAEELLNKYCLAMYQRYLTYQEAAKIAGLDWRTIKKRSDMEMENLPQEYGD